MNSFILGLGDPIAIVGMGVSGNSVLKLLRKAAPEKKILTFDSRPGLADWSNLEEMISKAKPRTLVVTPGVPLNIEPLKTASYAGIKITSELSLAYSCLAGEKIAAVTGSVGKSTTTSLLEKALQVQSQNNLAAGNIGKPLAEYICEVLEKKRPRADWIALELSSFQLENFENLQAEHSILTFFTANHLERYTDIEDYYKTKWSLVDKTKGTVFINGDSSGLMTFAKKIGLSEKIKVCAAHDSLCKIHGLKQSQLLGEHNQQNLSLAAHLVTEINLGDEAILALKEFRGLPHRLENLGARNGVTFVNDSKATALDSVYSAVVSLGVNLTPGKNLYVLLGGKDKNLPWDWLGQIKDFSFVKPIYFGECAKKAKTLMKIEGPAFSNLGPAVDHALSLLKEGDILLLSPGGSSLDEFKNFEERGQFFKEKVNQYS